MPDAIITVENLSKRYIIGHQKVKGDGLRHVIERAACAPFDWMRRTWNRSPSCPSHFQPADTPSSGPFQFSGPHTPDFRSRAGEEFWALRDVNFTINQGQVIGIIGRNGAGKSTLLKILSRITEPTSGRIRLRGRVASLLEVGTGFHHELTGRENIFLNGAILGMTKAEIKRKFDEIVAFSEVEKFIDTPVKRYSSGMYVRLAFAVAAHLEPEILIVDEVLAVGDGEFQKKCLGKMRNVAEIGRTVLFVSHNMAAVQALCTGAMLMEHGKVAAMDSTDKVVSEYLNSFERLQETSIDLRSDRDGGELFRFTKVEFLDPQSSRQLESLISGQPVLIRIHFRNQTSRTMRNVSVGIAFSNLNRVLLFACRSRAVGSVLEVAPGPGYTDCILRKCPFKGGSYHYSLYAENGTRLDDARDLGTVCVEEGDYYGTGCLPATGMPGVLVEFEWQEQQGSAYEVDSGISFMIR